MYFTNGSSCAFEMLMRGKPGFDRYENGGCADCEDCNTCHFYRPHWKYQFCVYAECPVTVLVHGFIQKSILCVRGMSV